jgi:hypothetical protein
MWLKRMLVAAILVLAAALNAGAATASPLDEGWDEPAKVAKVSWFLVSSDGPHSVTIAVSTGYCVGEKRPRLLRPHVDWHPERAVITARLFVPAVHFGPHEACGGVGLGISKQFRFTHRIAGRVLYDGSTTPPQRREPSG